MLTILKVKITANKNYRNSISKANDKVFSIINSNLVFCEKRSHGKLYFIEHKKSFIKISVAEFYEHRKQRR